MSGNLIEQYLTHCAAALVKTDASVLNEIAGVIIQKRHMAVFTAGNGGSAATASHFVNDLVKGCRVNGRTGFKAQCLNDSVPVVTCLANDFSYEDIYSVQLETFAKKGDLLILFSGSGNSPNILKAARAAREMGVTVVGLTGFDGGALKPLCDICLTAPSACMEEIEDLHMCCCHCMINYIRKQLETLWGIEIIRRPSAEVKSILFDFDGTLSLLREGWQQVMIPYFTEVLSAVDKDADEAEIKRLVTDFVDLLTGKQTIFQCQKLAEEVEKRGGKADDPYAYKREYLRRLMERIDGRLAALRNGGVEPDEFLVPGSRAFLEKLNARGVKLYLASGTDEADVLEEARLLRVDKLFRGGVYGALDSVTSCSKELVIKRILDENHISGAGLMGFGDGFVEIQLVKECGGYAVAVATDEVKRAGINAWKRERLLKAGADAVIPDFADVNALEGFIFGE